MELLRCLVEKATGRWLVSVSMVLLVITMVRMMAVMAMMVVMTKMTLSRYTVALLMCTHSLPPSLTLE